MLPSPGSVEPLAVSARQKSVQALTNGSPQLSSPSPAPQHAKSEQVQSARVTVSPAASKSAPEPSSPLCPLPAVGLVCDRSLPAPASSSALPHVREAADMFHDAAGHANSSGATFSFLRAVSESLKSLSQEQSVHGGVGGLPIRGVPGASEALQAAALQATEASAILQTLCGPFVHVNLVVTDARPEQADLKEFVSGSGARFETLDSFNQYPVVLFSPCLSPPVLLMRAASRPDGFINPESPAVAPTGSGEEETFSTHTGSLGNRVAPGSSPMSEGSANVLIWHSTRALSGLQAALSAAVAISRLGGASTFAAAKAAVAALRLQTRQLPVVQRATNAAPHSGSLPGRLSRSTAVRRVALADGHVPSWYTGRPLSIEGGRCMDEAVTVVLVPEVADLPQDELKSVYSRAFGLVFDAGAKKRDQDGVKKGNMSYKTFTAPFLPAIFRVLIGEGKTVVCFLDGNRFEKDAESKINLSVPSPISVCESTRRGSCSRDFVVVGRA